MRQPHRVLLWICWSVFLFGSFSASASSAETDWTIKPVYSTPEGRVDESLFVSVANKGGKKLYDQSKAVLIVEDDYAESSVWQSVAAPAHEHADRLRSALEAQGFKVEEWENLNGKQLSSQLTEIFAEYGNLSNGRVFFYFYGHGYMMPATDQGGQDRAFLVPVDAPDPTKDRLGFLRKAINISQIAEDAKNSDTKHMFFAFEACQAGAIIWSLSGPEVMPEGYLLSAEFQHRSRQVITAGSVGQDVPAAGVFTDTLIEGFSKADVNGDGYVTGQELMTYVAQKVPQRAPYQHPERGSFQHYDGDILIAAASPRVEPGVQKTPQTGARYALCRHPDNGLDHWQRSENWFADSDWRGGGSSPSEFCGAAKLKREADYPGRNVRFLNSDEQHRALYTPFKHDEYRYTCKFVDEWEPVYREARSPACGPA